MPISGGKREAALQLYLSRSLQLSTPEKTSYLKPEAHEKKKINTLQKNSRGNPVGK